MPVRASFCFSFSPNCVGAKGDSGLDTNGDPGSSGVKGGSTKKALAGTVVAVLVVARETGRQVAKQAEMVGKEAIGGLMRR